MNTSLGGGLGSGGGGGGQDTPPEGDDEGGGADTPLCTMGEDESVDTPSRVDRGADTTLWCDSKGGEITSLRGGGGGGIGTPTWCPPR